MLVKSSKRININKVYILSYSYRQVREAHQKLQGLEIRAADYASRYDTAQAQVVSLSQRLEEVTQYAKDTDGRASALEVPTGL